MDQQKKYRQSQSDVPDIALAAKPLHEVAASSACAASLACE
jgi:hypothetical protein